MEANCKPFLAQSACGHRRCHVFPELAKFLPTMFRRQIHGHGGGANIEVNGHSNKPQHVCHLSPAALKVVSKLQESMWKFPGPHEVSKTVRHQTDTNPVCYGSSISSTFSPSEGDVSAGTGEKE